MTSPYATDEYLEMLRGMHANAPWGASGYKYVADVVPFYDRLGCKSLLDYGSGAESLRKIIEAVRPDIGVRCYDPAVVGRDAEPEPADLVVCTDVLEHVEEQFVTDVLGDIYQLAQVGAFLNIALTKAKRILPDGRNAHITIQPAAWWMSRVGEHPWSAVDYEARKKHVLMWLVK